MGVVVRIEQLGHACFEMLDLFDQRLDDVKMRGRHACTCCGIGWAALDLSGPYPRVYEIALPNALQVADTFHVVKLANLKLDMVRQRVQTEQLGHRGRKTDPLYRARKLFVIADELLPEDCKQRLLGLLFAGDPNGEARTAWIARIRP